MEHATKVGIKGNYYDISIREVISNIAFTIVYNPLTITDIDQADEWVTSSANGKCIHKISAIEHDTRKNTRRIFYTE
ncbi:hypothetical protein [Brochothrix thermosphacta]|uniref:hypothetical protein n=1 Tax=Brochothrix thermosphacta TaxID=2756 RepID=UPI00083F996B|nr:hypothetical protein [Brochothrix thermosphacta]ODJ66654.1 hypothetical protein BFR35_05610 [Brochothrix thermosphacta]